MGSRSRFPKQFSDAPRDKYGRQESPIEVMQRNVSKVFTLLLEAAHRIDKLEEKVFPKEKVKAPKIKEVKEKKKNVGRKTHDKGNN